MANLTKFGLSVDIFVSRPHLPTVRSSNSSSSSQRLVWPARETEKNPIGVLSSHASNHISRYSAKLRLSKIRKIVLYAVFESVEYRGVKNYSSFARGDELGQSGHTDAACPYKFFSDNKGPTRRYSLRQSGKIPKPSKRIDSCESHPMYCQKNSRRF